MHYYKLAIIGCLFSMHHLKHVFSVIISVYHSICDSVDRTLVYHGRQIRIQILVSTDLSNNNTAHLLNVSFYCSVAERSRKLHAFQCYSYLNLCNVVPIDPWRTAVNKRGKIYSLYF